MLHARSDSRTIKQVLNDEIAATARTLSDDELRAQLFYCECDDLTCVARVSVSRVVHGELRRRGEPLLAADCLS